MYYLSLYDLFLYCKENDCTDIVVDGIAKFIYDNPDKISYDESKEYCEFIGANYDELVKAWNGGDCTREAFQDVVDTLATVDTENSEETTEE